MIQNAAKHTPIAGKMDSYLVRLFQFDDKMIDHPTQLVGQFGRTARGTMRNERSLPIERSPLTEHCQLERSSIENRSVRTLVDRLTDRSQKTLLCDRLRPPIQ